MLDRKLEYTLGEGCEKNHIIMMICSSLEQGLLACKIGTDYMLDSKEAREGIPWIN